MVKKSFIKLKLLAKAIRDHAFSFINQNPKFRRCVLVVVHRFGLYNTARVFYAFLVDFKYLSSTKNATRFIPTDINHLTPHAREICSELKSSIHHCNRRLGK